MANALRSRLLLSLLFEARGLAHASAVGCDAEPDEPVGRTQHTRAKLTRTTSAAGHWHVYEGSGSGSIATHSIPSANRVPHRDVTASGAWPRSSTVSCRKKLSAGTRRSSLTRCPSWITARSTACVMGSFRFPNDLRKRASSCCVMTLAPVLHGTVEVRVVRARSYRRIASSMRFSAAVLGHSPYIGPSCTTTFEGGGTGQCPAATWPARRALPQPLTESPFLSMHWSRRTRIRVMGRVWRHASICQCS